MTIPSLDELLQLPPEELEGLSQTLRAQAARLRRAEQEAFNLGLDLGIVTSAHYRQASLFRRDEQGAKALKECAELMGKLRVGKG